MRILLRGEDGKTEKQDNNARKNSAVPERGPWSAQVDDRRRDAPVLRSAAYGSRIEVTDRRGRKRARISLPGDEHRSEAQCGDLAIIGTGSGGQGFVQTFRLSGVQCARINRVH